MIALQSALRFLKILLPVACAAHGSAQWLIQNSGTTAGLRAIHTVDGNVAWASGTGGTVIHTDDGGAHWERCAVPPGAEKLDFRGVWAWNAQRAVVMSIGEGDQSRLYKTIDGCKTSDSNSTSIPTRKVFGMRFCFSMNERAPSLAIR